MNDSTINEAHMKKIKNASYKNINFLSISGFYELIQINNPFFYWLRCVKDKLLAPVIRWCDRRSLTPIYITICGFIIGVGSLLVLFKNYWLFVLLMLISSFFDCIDGALARYQKHVSSLGQQLDYAVDVTLMLFMYITLCIWLHAYAWLWGAVIFLLVFVANLYLGTLIRIAPGRQTVFIPSLLGYPMVGIWGLSLYATLMFLLLLKRLVFGKRLTN